MQEEGGDDVGELLDVPPPLELYGDEEEDEQELRRFMFPEEVVQALDQENAAALASIRSEWQRLVAETEARNRKKIELLAKNKGVLDKYAADVVACYARGFVKDVVMGAALRTAANELTLAAARAAYEADVERIAAENARVAALHTQEVQEKIAKEQQYKQLVEQWEKQRMHLAKEYQIAIALAKKEHMQNIIRAEKEWQIRREQVRGDFWR